MLSPECQAALYEANMAPDAIERAVQNSDAFNQAAPGYGRILGAIAVRETGVVNRNERQAGGLGRGIYQIDIGRNPGMEKIANDPASAAKWAGNKLLSDINYFRNQGYSDEVSTLAGIRAYHRGRNSTDNILSNDLRHRKEITSHSCGSIL